LSRRRARVIDGGSAKPDASLAEIARRYGIARRVLCRWKQELTAAPVFVAVQITDADAPPAAAPTAEEHAS
jgi:transposase-like protein